MDNIITPNNIYKIASEKGLKAINQLLCAGNITWGSMLKNQSELPELCIFKNIAKTVSLLEFYRKKYLKNLPVVITSGWRSKKYNAAIGGAPNSFHTLGLAVDFVCRGLSPGQVQKILDPVHTGGLEYAPTWTHIDLRGRKARFSA